MRKFAGLADEVVDGSTLERALSLMEDQARAERNEADYIAGGCRLYDVEPDGIPEVVELRGVAQGIEAAVELLKEELCYAGHQVY